MVARYHNRAYSGFRAQFNGVFDLRPRRVYHSDEPDENHIAFKRVLVVRYFVFNRRAEYAERVFRHFSVGFSDFRKIFFGYRSYFPAVENARAFIEHHIGRAFYVSDFFSATFVDGSHKFTNAVKRYFVRASPLFFKRGVIEPVVFREHYERGFRRVSEKRLFRLNAVVAKRERSRKQFSTFVPVVIFRRHRAAGKGKQFFHRHTVKRKRTRLVRTYYFAATERFHRGKVTYNRVPFAHLLNADGKDDGNHRGQPFGNRRNGYCHRSHKRAHYFVRYLGSMS